MTLTGVNPVGNRGYPCARCGHAKRWHAPRYASLAGGSPCTHPHLPAHVRLSADGSDPNDYTDECFEYAKGSES